MQYDPKTLQRVDSTPSTPPSLDPWPNAEINVHAGPTQALLRLMRASSPSPHTVWIDGPYTSISQVISVESSHRTFEGLSLFEGMHLGLGCFVFEEREPAQWWVELRETGHILRINDVPVSGATRVEHGAELVFNEVVFRFEQSAQADLALESTMEFSDELVQHVQDTLEPHTHPSTHPIHSTPTSPQRREEAATAHSEETTDTAALPINERDQETSSRKEPHHTQRDDADTNPPLETSQDIPT